MYQITAKSGGAKGTSWAVNTKPLIFGRDTSCDINVNDPLVSRRHCEIVRDGDGLSLKDLGSSNATFVNGDPIDHTRLKPGDEVAVGSAVFLVTCVRGNSGVSAPDMPLPPPTRSLAMGKPIYLDRNSAALFSQGRPRTAADLSDLFAQGRALSEASTTSGLITALMQLVFERFEPRAVCLALARGTDARFTIYPPAAEEAFGPKVSVREIIQQVLDRQHGVLIPESYRREGKAGIRTTAAAPMVLGKDVIGALVAQTESPAHIFDEADLEFLLAQAQVAAPYFRAIERMEILERENELLIAGAAEGAAIVGESAAINLVRTVARDCARSELNALVYGETGTGKDLVVRLIHRLSNRSEAPLTIVNCATIPPELLEIELFGYERGAFSGARGQKKGLFEECDGGTLFLDELCGLSIENQTRLLRAIETGIFRRLGGTSDISVDVRVIAATNRNIVEEVERGKFQRDLYHRLNMFEIFIPPLRDRRSDIRALAEHFHRKARERNGYKTVGFTREAIQYLEQQPWRGNVRELRNVVERAMVVAPYETIRPEDLKRKCTSDVFAPAEAPFLSLDELEMNHLREALRRADNNIKAASDLLGISRSTLYRKIRDYNLLSL